MEHLDTMVKLTNEESKKFAEFIKINRDILIPSPKNTAKKATEVNKIHIETLINSGKISQVILELRQLAYDQFLIEESHFNGVILGGIGAKFNAPKQILKSVSNVLYSIRNESQDVFTEQVSRLFGEFAGNISPYIYQLCLSNTQSRRARAGKTFEGIIYFLYDYFNFKYDSQASIGKNSFAKLNLGKVVDSILPSVQAFSDFRNKTIVGSMKTTLRERWQEVVEEITRSNLPNIHLLTVDDNIPEKKAKQMAEHNIILVVIDSVKQQKHLVNKRNVIDFETYFNEEIPSIMHYWNKSHD
jgi:hypothetical protein